MNNSTLMELADTWELQAETGGDGLNKFDASARETLRACADTIRMLVSTETVHEPPSEKQQKLFNLANRIDHEQLWRWAGMDHHKMTPEQKDRLDAGVALRRYARLLKPDCWLIFPPVGPVHFSSPSLDAVVLMARKHLKEEKK